MKRYFAFILLVLLATNLLGQSTKYLSLKPGKGRYIPVNYYISDAVDDRADTAYFGRLMKAGKLDFYIFQGGTKGTVNSYLHVNSKPQAGLQPIVLHVTDVNIEGRRVGSGWDMTAKVVLSFSVGKRKLVDYTAKGTARLYDDPKNYIEDFIAKAIDGDLRKFDDWWLKNKGSVVTNDEVKVNVSLSKISDKPNQIIYDLQKPLAIEDFIGPVNGKEQEMAATMSGIGIRYSTTTQNSQLVINVTVSAYFDKAQSWFKQEGKNARILAHEQLHFDITAIKACQLVQKIRNTVITQDNFEQLLAQLQRTNAKEAEEEEELYDNETNHGIIREKQEEWMIKVKEQLKNVGCF